VADALALAVAEHAESTGDPVPLACFGSSPSVASLAPSS